MDIVGMLSKIGISQSFMQDFVLLLVLVGLTIAVALGVGRRRLISALFGIYISFSLLMTITGEYLENYWYEIAFFFVVLVCVTLLGKKIFKFSVSKSDFMWRVFMFSFLEVVAISSVVFVILPKKIALGYISKNAYEYLTSPAYHFLWLLLPLVFLYSIKKRLG